MGHLASIPIYRFQLRQYTNIPISMSDIPIYKFQLANIPAFLPICNIQILVVRHPKVIVLSSGTTS